MGASARSRKEKLPRGEERKRSGQNKRKARSQPHGWYGGGGEGGLNSSLQLNVLNGLAEEQASWSVLDDMTGWGPCSSSEQHQGSVNCKGL